jgi:ATP-dependent RNA helicase DHX8/PRP22
MLTKIGMKMAELPLEPSGSKMLMTAVDMGCTQEIITIISMLEVHNIFFRPRENA